MAVLIGVGSPKGGVGKTTIACNCADTLAAHGNARVLLIDADVNRCASDWIGGGDEQWSIDVAIGNRPSQLRKLGALSGYEYAWVDLPGAEAGGELKTLLTGTDRQPIIDLLIVPTQASTMDLRPVIRAVRSDIEPTGVPYALVLSHVDTVSLSSARDLQKQLRDQGITVLDTVVRRYGAHVEANAACVPIHRYGGRHSYAREGERDMRDLTREIAALVGADVTIPDAPGRH